jgi:CheY-like chemotaxis protein
MTKEEKSTQWKTLVPKQAESGLSGAAFYRGQRLNRDRFYHWRRHFQSQDIADPPSFVQLVPSEALVFFGANSDPIDLVITDMTMPQMTGDKLAREIQSIRSDIPIILRTGYSEKISEERAKKSELENILKNHLN